MDNLKEKLNVLYKKEEIQERIEKIANQIDKDYEGKEILVISVLKGAIFFTVDLVTKMKTPIILETIQVSSYQGTQSTRNIIMKKGLDSDISGKDVLIVEDIIDTGYTLKYLKEYLQTLNPKSIKIAVLLDKKERRKTEIDVDYTCFEIENKFVVGYGFDVDERGRNIPFIGTLEE